jgi:CYTH domain-containing protein
MPYYRKEQMQLAIIKKKKCDSKALQIVEQLLEPLVDPKWLLENVCTFIIFKHRYFLSYSLIVYYSISACTY